MYKIPVHRRIGDQVNTEAEWFDISDINFIKPERAKDKKSTLAVIYTNEYEFLPGIKIEALIGLLSNMDGFIKVDRGRMINLKNNPQIDRDRGIIYYNNNTEVFVELAPKYSEEVLKHF